MKKQPSHAKSAVQLMAISPSLRTWRGFLALLRVFGQNIVGEGKRAFLGVRALEMLPAHPDFAVLRAQVEKYTFLSADRLGCLFQVVSQAVNLPGDVAEFGVYQGGSAKAIAWLTNKYAPEKKTHLFDTFTGFPQTGSAMEYYQTGQLNQTSVDAVKGLLQEQKNTQFWQGPFAATLPKLADDQQFCFIHVDCDLFSSIWAVCESVFPRLIPGGMALFDDYGFVSCPGAKQAVDQFFASRRETPIYLATGQALVVKL